MKILKTLVPIFAAAAILTGCGGPSESDCANTVNKLLQKIKHMFTFQVSLTAHLQIKIGYLLSAN